MTQGNAHLTELMIEARDLPNCPEKRQILNRALILSQELGDEESEFSVRQRIIEYAEHTGDTDAQLSNFAWCLATYDKNPELYSSYMDNLMWYFKWMISPLDDSPIFSLAQTESILDDMESHYRQANLGMNAVVMMRFQHAWNVGDLDKARAFRAEYLRTPRDSHSDCEACVQSRLTCFAAEIGEETLALTLLDEILSKQLTCITEPEEVLASTSIIQLRAGRLEAARNAHLNSYRKAHNNPERISTITSSLLFCAVTGNEARGLNILEKHLSWLTHDQLNERGQMNMLAAGGVLLDAVTKAGYGDQMIRGADSPALTSVFGPHEGPWIASDLAEACWKAAYQLGYAFDERNQNTHISGRLTHDRALLDEHYDVPIKTHVFLPPINKKSEPSTPAEWLDYAGVLAIANLKIEAREAALKALDGDLMVRARALNIAIGTSVQLKDEESAQHWMELRHQTLVDDHRIEEAESESRLGLDLFRSNYSELIPKLEAEADRLKPEGNSFALGRVLNRLGISYLNTAKNDRHLTRALTVYESARDLVRPESRFDVIRGMVAVMVRMDNLEDVLELLDQVKDLDMDDRDKVWILPGFASVLSLFGRQTQAAKYADEALKVYSQYGINIGVARTADTAALVYQKMEDFDEELTRLRIALQAAINAEIPTRKLRCRIGTALANTGHGKEGVEYLREALNEVEDDGPPTEIAEIHDLLGQALEATGEWVSASSHYWRAGELWIDANESEKASDMFSQQSAVLRNYEHYSEARIANERALELLDRSQFSEKEIYLLNALAFTKSQIHDPSALEDIDRAYSLSRNQSQRIDLRATKAQILFSLDHEDEAAELFIQASKEYLDIDDQVKAAHCEHAAALILKNSDQETSLSLLNQALTRDHDDEDLRTSIIIELSKILESLGRTSEAADVRGRLNT